MGPLTINKIDLAFVSTELYVLEQYRKVNQELQLHVTNGLCANRRYFLLLENKAETTTQRERLAKENNI